MLYTIFRASPRPAHSPNVKINSTSNANRLFIDTPPKVNPVPFPTLTPPG